MPPTSFAFPNADPGPSLKVGATLVITADEGLSTCSLVRFTGASAVPTVISDTEIHVVIPSSAAVGAVEVVTGDGTFDTGADPFYPLVPGPWTDSPPLTETHTLIPSNADIDNTTIDTTTGVEHLDQRWDLAHTPSTHDGGTAWLGFNAVGRVGGDLADASEQTEDDPLGGESGGARADIFLQNLGDDTWAVMQLVVLFDFNVAGGLDPYSGSLPSDYHPGDPSAFEAEDNDYLTWITSIDVDADSETTVDDGSTVIEARILPVADFEYDVSPTVSPRQGRWFPGADLGGMRNAGSIVAFTGTSTATLSFTVNLDEIRIDDTYGSHAVAVFHFAEQVSHLSVLNPGNADFVFASASNALTATYNYQPPRWRWLIPQYGVGRTPLRQRQTSTGIHTAGTPLRQRQHYFGLRQRQTGI